MTHVIKTALKVLAASAMLATVIASPSLARSDRQGGQSGEAYQSYQNAPAAQDSGYWEHRREWDY